jgi:hypothetical protein
MGDVPQDALPSGRSPPSALRDRGSVCPTNQHAPNGDPFQAKRRQETFDLLAAYPRAMRRWDQPPDPARGLGTRSPPQIRGVKGSRSLPEPPSHCSSLRFWVGMRSSGSSRSCLCWGDSVGCVLGRRCQPQRNHSFHIRVPHLSNTHRRPAPMRSLRRLLGRLG